MPVKSRYALDVDVPNEDIARFVLKETSQFGDKICLVSMIQAGLLMKYAFN